MSLRSRLRASWPFLVLGLWLGMPAALRWALAQNARIPLDRNQR